MMLHKIRNVYASDSVSRLIKVQFTAKKIGIISAWRSIDPLSLPR